MPKQTIQEQIASMMSEDYGSNFGQDPSAGPARMPSDLSSIVQVTDAVGGQRHTEMKLCSAENCSNNLGGRTCGLAVIEVNQQGGCDNYETSGDSRYEDDEVPSNDDETIRGISDLMSTEIDVPSQRGKVAGIFGSFNNGSMS